jgi:cell division protein FtsL
MLRVLHALVIAALVVSAAWVYKIKFEATLQAERVSKLRAEIRRERDSIAILRAEWARLDNPARIQQLAERHLTLRPATANHFDTLDNLPERPHPLVPPGTPDPIGAVIESFADSEALSGPLPGPARR